MRCDEAQEFVSAMFDGEPVPPQAAEHTAHCAECQELLEGFGEMGAALRNYGSLLIAEPVPDRTWLIPRENKSMWLEKGLQRMRIPRIAFACLILLLVALGSRLALVEVRAHDEGSVLMLKLTPAQGDSIQCFVSTVNANHDNCSGFAQIDHSNLTFAVKTLRKEGDRVLLSIRSRVAPMGPGGFGPDTESSLPETQSWFTPGETLLPPGTGELKLALTGQWVDHIPVQLGGNNQLLDPAPNEVRLTSPLLLKNNQIAGDMFNSSADADQPGEGAFLYIPGEGRFILSPTKIEGAIPAKVELNRVLFESNGQKYVIVTGAPVIRGDNIWVLHEAAYKGPPEMMEHSELGAGLVSKLVHPEARTQ
jgi:hypothetical protein